MIIKRLRTLSAAVAAIGGVAAAAGRAHKNSTSAPERQRGPAGLPELSVERAFDSISLPRAADFWNKWHLVTVRFRKDNGEQRFIYANELAWNTIRQNRGVYPDGAMFGKVAFTVTDDPSFPNSAEPKYFSRMQLMRKDSRAYPRTDGWGYAILVGTRPPPYDSVEATATACHACHRLVPERDFVFSKATFLGSGLAPNASQTAAFRQRFVRKDVSALSAFQRQALSRLPSGRGIEPISAIYSLDMELFEGSLNESIGVLSTFAAHDTSVFAMWDEPHRRYAIAQRLSPAARCEPRVAVAMTDRGPLSQVSDGTGNSTRPPSTRIVVICGGAREAQ